MENQNVTINLSGINFKLDSETQEQIIKEVIKSVLGQIEANLLALTDEVKRSLESINEKYNAAFNTLSVSPSTDEVKKSVDALVQPVKRGRKKKIVEHKSSNAAKEIEVENTEKEDEIDGMDSKIHSDITLYKGYNTRPDVINDLGFKTLFDMLLFKYTKTGKAYDQEQFIIDAYLNESRLKIFANNTKVKKYVLSKYVPKTTGKKIVVKELKQLAQVVEGINHETLIETIDTSKILKGFCRKAGIETVNDALLYCNEVRLMASLEESVTKHSMIYQLAKFLCSKGFDSKSLNRFIDKIENGDSLAKAVKYEKPAKSANSTQSDANIMVYNQDIKEPETTEEGQFHSNRYHILTDAEIDALYSDITNYPFPEYLQETIFRDNKIKSIFELLFWFCGITRNFVSYQWNLDINTLLRLENILIENEFIEPIDKMESMSYAYESKYYLVIRWYRNRAIRYKLHPNKFNKNLTEKELNNLYMEVENMGYSKPILAIIKQNYIQFAIQLIAFMHYGCDTAYPKQFSPNVIEEIEEGIKANGLHTNRYMNYINGLRGHYYRTSMYIQKRKKESEIIYEK
ncbi:MAG: hypothetical protein LBJ17_04040 [Dysgonamonadaceae bacterium]|jgi:hypothetical protein|nr:hypothetical protein [Dysgonamonadaceae bacterium]